MKYTKMICFEFVSKLEIGNIYIFNFSYQILLYIIDN